MAVVVDEDFTDRGHFDGVSDRVVGCVVYDVSYGPQVARCVVSSGGPNKDLNKWCLKPDAVARVFTKASVVD